MRSGSKAIDHLIFLWKNISEIICHVQIGIVLSAISIVVLNERIHKLNEMSHNIRGR